MELIFQPADVGGTTFFTVLSAPPVLDIDPKDYPAIAYLGTQQERHLVNAPGVSTLELWRTDGTPESTGAVATLWQGNADGKQILITPSEAHGKLYGDRVLSGVSGRIQFHPYWLSLRVVLLH